MVGVPRSKGCLTCIQRHVKVGIPIDTTLEVTSTSGLTQQISAMKHDPSANAARDEERLVLVITEVANSVSTPSLQHPPCPLPMHQSTESWPPI